MLSAVIWLVFIGWRLYRTGTSALLIPVVITMNTFAMLLAIIVIIRLQVVVFGSDHNLHYRLASQTSQRQIWRLTEMSMPELYYVPQTGNPRYTNEGDEVGLPIRMGWFGISLIPEQVIHNLEKQPWYPNWWIMLTHRRS